MYRPRKDLKRVGHLAFEQRAKEVAQTNGVARGYTYPDHFFGMTVETPGYNYGYYGGPVEAWPTIPVSVARSWDVWSPGNGQIANLGWADLNPAPGVYNFTAFDAWMSTCKANGAQMVYTFGSPPAWAGGMTTNLADFSGFRDCHRHDMPRRNLILGRF